MRLPEWKPVGRKRRVSISRGDPDFVRFYDIDNGDFTALVLKLKSGLRLTEEENDRYGDYVLTIGLIVMENRKFKNKPAREKEGILEQQYMELLTGITTFDPSRGSSIYSYAYRIAYCAAIHYYDDIRERAERQEAIEEHCRRELEEYYDEFMDHKVRSINNG